MSTPGAARCSSSLRWSTSTGRTGSSASAAPRARPTWPAPKISTSGSALRSSAARARSALQPAASSRATESSVRPPQHWPISGPSGTSRVVVSSPRASMARAASMAMYSSWPPPMVPSIACGPTTIQAPASRGVEPRAVSTVTRAAVAWSPRKRSRSSGRTVMRLPPPRRQAGHRHQHALGRGRGFEARAGLVVGDAGDGHRQRLEDRDAEHERRLADRLRAADRRLAVLRPLRRGRR